MAPGGGVGSLALVTVGAIAGCGLRGMLGLADVGHLVLGTLAANVLGAFLAGLLVATASAARSRGFVFAIEIGFLRSFTTMSALAVQVALSWHQVGAIWATALMLGSLALGAAAYRVGSHLGARSSADAFAIERVHHVGRIALAAGLAAAVVAPIFATILDARESAGGDATEGLGTLAWGAILFVVAASVGGLVRHAIYGLAERARGDHPPRDAWPLGMLAVNLFGSALAGAIAGMAMHEVFAPVTALALLTGTCGALTTFSSLIADVARLAAEGRAGRAVVVLAVNAIACPVLAAAFLFSWA